MTNQNPNSKPQIGELVEKYRFVIGGALLILILVGSGLLLYRENYSKPKLADEIKSLEARLDELETAQKSEAINPKSGADQPLAENIQVTDPGQVAGQNTDNSKQVTSSQKVSGKVNLNTATAAQLDSLPGIGMTYAGRIIDYRNANGGFKTIEEIKNVKGIGEKTFEKFKDMISI